jgi:hypothetical protein
MITRLKLVTLCISVSFLSLLSFILPLPLQDSKWISLTQHTGENPRIQKIIQYDVNGCLWSKSINPVYIMNLSKNAVNANWRCKPQLPFALISIFFVGWTWDSTCIWDNHYEKTNTYVSCKTVHVTKGRYSPPPFWKFTHFLYIHYLKEKTPFTCKNSSASGDFAPWTPTRALPWTHWGLQDSPQTPCLLLPPPPSEIPGSATQVTLYNKNDLSQYFLHRAATFQLQAIHTCSLYEICMHT